MSSFEKVNYSLRPSKGIQRQLVFEAVRTVRERLDLRRLAYVGFGSVWFTDFVMAHKLLDIEDMVSMERDPIGISRARFNTPYATVRVEPLSSNEALPKLRNDEVVGSRPWMVWLDYDEPYSTEVAKDVRQLIENLETGSVLLVTFNGMDGNYGRGPERPDFLRTLFGSVVPDDLSKHACKESRMQETLADLAMDSMKAVAVEAARREKFVPAFRLIYRDNSPMVTVGGFILADPIASAASAIVRDETWRCMPAKPIQAPHLTVKEAASLQSLLPRAARLTQHDVRGLGFELEMEQIEAFESYYRQYPAFAQIVA
jgi:hypothetical protein